MDNIVIAPKKTPPGLRHRAAHAGMDPVAFMRDVLSRHATQQDAANELGITRETLKAWQTWCGLTVVREK